jgi:glycosyltransferase involved in cell wall biosynthesis
MKIGIEARWLTFERTGFGNYAFHLLKELSQIDNQNHYLIYLNSEYTNDAIFSNNNFAKKIICQRPEIYKHISIPFDIMAKRRRFDFFHFLYNAPSLFMPCPFILTVHDVSFKYVPDMISKKNLFSITAQLSLNAKRAHQIISVSENTKKDIMKYFKIPEEKIVVIYEGVNETFKIITDDQKKREIAEKYQLPAKFILYVGTYLPHKNLETLLHAYHALKQTRRISHALVLAGKKGRNFETISNLISKLDLTEDVKTVGFVPEEDLPYLYNLSDLFVFPSLYEGFGLPLLEAMACGVPVIAANTSCLPEIGGDAAIYFSAKNSLELSDVLEKVIKDKDLRHKIITNGFRRIHQFSWRKMAEKTLQVYETMFG